MLVAVGLGRSLVLGSAEARKTLLAEIGLQWINGSDNRVQTQVEFESIKKKRTWQISLCKRPET